LPNVARRDAVDESLDDSSGGPLESEALVGVVETALANALLVSAEAERWEIVARLAAELAARRRARRSERRTGLSTPKVLALECAAHEPAGHADAQHAVRDGCRRATRSG
jgi:hypothetical protein